MLEDPEGERVSSPRALIVEHASRTVAAAALRVGRERGLVTVRHLGQAPNWFDPEPPALDEVAYDALADALSRQPGDLLVLEELAEDGPLVGALLRRWPEAEVIHGPRSFHVRPGTARSRSRARRREAGRLARRAAEKGTPLVVTAMSRWPPIAQSLDATLALQARSWRGREPDAFTGTPAGLAFVRDVIEAMGREDRIRLVRLDVGGRLAAFHLSFVWGTRAVVYKTAFDRGLTGLPGLGWGSLLATVDRLAGEGVRDIELGPGGDEYKAHLADARSTVTVRLPLSRVGRAYLLAAGAKQGVVRLVRGSAPPRRTDRVDGPVPTGHPGGEEINRFH